MTLAIFDLDNTLLAGDSDYLWGRFLIEQGVVPRDQYERDNQRYYDDYTRGNLDILEFLAFQLRPLAAHDPALLRQWRKVYIEQKILAVLLPKARDLIARHRNNGDTLVIVTATNRFITEPIAKLYGIDDLIATEPETVAGRYTGRVAGVPSFREGKITRLVEWMGPRGLNLAGSWFYSDSHNDLPLLEIVDNPVAVDPDDTLTAHAETKGWPIITLR
ncbi:MAG: HAD-superfamily hydrolase [Gammaproteobacteria bacterium]|nr:MAG: HAD-superfamily hydrolase [Gammaproteobacteria bacterium]TND03447.1 MAG: HAD-superfamily hydrolase [Gammaproteobacteria bacterium]